jgi:Flp pilus assembly protein TadD
MPEMISCYRAAGVAVLTAFLASNSASAQQNSLTECGPLQNAYGPYDYRTHRQELGIVEQYHLTPDVESLKRGSTGTIGGDLDYTLRASPNHVRALTAIANWAVLNKSEKLPGAHYTVSCYFDRAIRFADDDPAVHMIYGTYLHRTGRRKEALKEYRRAEDLAPNNGNLQYNLGLLYFDLGDSDQALQHAHKAYALGFSLGGLKKKLVSAGKWREAKDSAPPERASEGTQ